MDKIISIRIRNLREDHDLTQKEIAAYLNMSQRGYSEYELGNNDLPIHILIKLAIYYQVSTDYILGLTDEKELFHPRNKKIKT